MARARSYTVFLGGELFSLKHLSGNAQLGAAVRARSRGRFRCVLPQDFVAPRGRSGKEIRDRSLRALVAADAALFAFDGTDLDSGTVVEFVYAKFADIPAVLLRTDIRNAGDHRAEPWNVMASNFPRTVSVIAPALFDYRHALRANLRSRNNVPARQGVATVKRQWSEVAGHCIRALDRVLAMPPILPARLRASVYQWLALAPALEGRKSDLAREFARLLEAKIARGTL